MNKKTNNLIFNFDYLSIGSIFIGSSQDEKGIGINVIESPDLGYSISAVGGTVKNITVILTPFFSKESRGQET